MFPRLFKSVAIRQFAFAASLVAAGTLALTAEAFAKSGRFASTGKYSVSGTVKVDDSGKITLSGFKSSRGPDVYVYVGNGSAKTRVAKLKRFSGAQSYKISPALAKKISTVHIYCKRFSSNFGTARLK